MPLSRSTLIVAAVFLLAAFGCCTRPSGPCSLCYDRVRTTTYDLSPEVTHKLDGLNASLLADQPTGAVWLNVCNNIALTNIVLPEIAEHTRASCDAPGLSEKQRADCKSPDCGARLKAEWCAGLADVLGQHLTACNMYRYDGRKCEYGEPAP